MEIILGVFGIALCVFGCVVKFGKKISLIPAITDERLEKIKKVDVVANEFGYRLIMMGLSCIFMLGASIILGTVGSVIGLIVLLVSVVSWNTLSTSVDKKIKSKKY